MSYIDLKENRKWRRLDLPRKPRDSRCKRESRLSSSTEKRKLKNIDSSKNALDSSTKLELKLKEKREKLKSKLIDLSKKEELKSIAKSKS